MYKHELYKIFTRKSIYVVLFFIILTMIYASNYSDMVMKDPIYEELNDTWGGPITEEKADGAREMMRASDERAADGPYDMTSEEMHASNVHFFVARADMSSQELKEHKELLKTEIQDLDSGSYEYKEASKELNMLENLEEPNGFYLMRAWRGMINLIKPSFGILFLSVLILIGLTPVFSDEHSQGTAGLISATKHGKKRIVIAKIMAGLTYVFIVFVILHLVNLIIQVNIHGGFEGWDAPMQSFIDGSTYSTIYKTSPFNWNVLQLYAITLSVQFLASAALAILVLLVSSFIKNTMTAFFLSGAIFVTPYLFTQLGLGETGIFTYITSFSYLELLKVQGLLENFIAYNIFGYPILYPTLLLIIFTFITVGLIILIYKRILNGQIDE